MALNFTSEISVVITCHNEEKFIEKCVTSVLKQTKYNLIKEILVINDSSTDNSNNILKNLEIKCPKLKIINTNNRSLSKSRNLGVDLSNGNYIALLDGDDYWSNTKIENQYKIFKSLDTNYGLVYTNYIDEDLKYNKSSKISVKSFNNFSENQLINYFCQDGPIVPSTIMVASDVFKKLGKFDEKLKYYEDTDFYLRVLQKYKIYHSPDYSCYKTRHSQQITNKLFELISYGDAVIKNAVLRNIDLEKYKKIRLARNRTKAAIQSITYYNYKLIALRLIMQSLKYNPFNSLSWIIFFSLFFPRRIILFIYNFYKKID